MHKSQSRLEFWATYLLYMVGFFFVLMCADATVNGKWGEIFLNLNLISEDDYYRSKFPKPDRSGKNGKAAGTAENTNSASDMPLKNLSPELVEKLQQGGYTIFFRHAARDNPESSNIFDRAPLVGDIKLLPPYETGVCLNESGRSEAVLIGEVFRRNKIPVGEIYSSPICRAVETAVYAFGRVDFVSSGIALNNPMTQEEIARRNEEGKKLLLKKPKPGTNTVLAGHGGVLENIIGFKHAFAQGSAAVLKLSDDETLSVIAVIDVDAFAKSLPVDFSLKPYPGPAN